MTQPQPPITRTTHTLPFDKLSPRDFERLCLWLVEREGYERAEHLGAAGSEQGRDIVAWREGQLWAFQCKRVRSFGLRNALVKVEKVLALPEAERPVGLVFLVTCDVSAKTREKVRKCCAGEIECHLWAGTELGKKVKCHPDIVEEFFQADRGNDVTLSWWDRFRHHPLIFYPTVAFTVLVAIVGLLAGLISMGADIGGARQQLQEWDLVRAFPSAGEDEILILIATFHHTEGVVDTSAYNEIRRAIQEAAEELSFSYLRVEVEPTRLAADDRAGAEKLGKRYNASMVIWGADTGARITVNYLNLKQPDFTAAEVQISETERTQLANPSACASFVTEDLPSQLTFLSLFAIGQSYYIEEAYDDSIRMIKKAVDSLPPEMEPPEGLAEAYFRLGWLYQWGMDNHEQAVANYNQAIKFKPDGAGAYINRGIAYYEKGNYDHAVADFGEAIKFKPDYAVAYIIRGLAYYKKGGYDHAIADYDQAILLQPDYAFLAYNYRGFVYYEKGNYDRAITDYDQAILLQPDYARAYYNRGLAYYKKGAYHRAIADYDQAILLQPNYAFLIYSTRGFAYSELEKYALAISDFTKAIELNPDDAFAYNNRGWAYSQLGNYTRAFEDFEKSVQLNPDNPWVYYNRGLTYANLEDRENAVADLQMALQLSEPPLDENRLNTARATLEGLRDQ